MSPLERTGGRLGYHSLSQICHRQKWFLINYISYLIFRLNTALHWSSNFVTCRLNEFINFKLLSSIVATFYLLSTYICTCTICYYTIRVWNWYRQRYKRYKYESFAEETSWSSVYRIIKSAVHLGWDKSGFSFDENYNY